MARYSGRKGVFYLSVSGTTAASNVLGITKWSIDMSTDKTDVTAMGDTTKRQIQGLPKATAKLSYLWEHDVNVVFSAAGSGDGALFYLYQSADAPTEYFYGACWVDFTQAGDVNGAVGGDINLAANGAWTYKQAA